MDDIKGKIVFLDSIINSFTKNLIDFLNSTTEYKECLSTINKEYNIEFNNKFNIFTSLSPHYYYENLHSDILKLIFDPNTDSIGNPEYIKIFINYIEIFHKKKINLDCQTIKIEREKDRIDLLISDSKKNCILIENKINNAGDRKNQIGAYYIKLKEKKYNIQAVVYIKLSPQKTFLKDYSIEDEILRNEIVTEKLVEIPVVNKNNRECFVNDVINKCVDVTKNSDKITSTVYLSHYSHLLKILGGKFMASDQNVKALYGIFMEENSLESFRSIGFLWDQQKYHIGNVFKDYFQKELKFGIHPEQEETTVFKIIKDGINIGFHNDLSFGFVYTPQKTKIFSSNKALFKELLEDDRLQRYFTSDVVGKGKDWFWRTIDYNKIKSLADLKTMENELEKLLKEKLK